MSRERRYWYKTGYRPGACQRVLEDGKRCGVAFHGPPSRRYCDEHSQHVRYTGRDVDTAEVRSV